MKVVKELLGLNETNIKILKVEEIHKNNKKIKSIIVIGTNKKEKCPICSKYTKSIHDKLKPSKIKYLKMAEYDTEISLIKRRFICHKCNKKITENINLSKYRSNISNKLEIKIRKDLLKYNLSIKYIAEINNVSPTEVRNVLIDAMKNYPSYQKTLPEVISFDEFKADTNYGKYAFIMNDPVKKKVLDILPNRKKEYLINYFTRVENRNNVKYVISDMYETYLIVTKLMFPNAKFIVDKFHYIRYIMDALDDIRIRLQKEYGYNSKEYKILKNKKNIALLRSRYIDINWYVYSKRYEHGRYIEKLNINILNNMLEISDELNRGYELKELFLGIINNSTFESAKTDLRVWIELCRQSEINEFIEASNTVENWLDYIVNSFIDERFTNGFTEGINNKIKVIKRVGFGYKNFDFFRLRLLYIFNGKISGNTKEKNRKSNKNEKIKK